MSALDYNNNQVGFIQQPLILYLIVRCSARLFRGVLINIPRNLGDLIIFRYCIILF